MRKKKAIAPKMKGCLNCGPERPSISMHRELSVGFGSVDVSRNGKCVWAGDMEKQFHPVNKDMGKPKRLISFENMARKLKGDWRVKFNGPLNSSTFQRHGKNKWVLIEQGMGFA